MQHALQAGGQVGPGRHLVRDPRVADLGLGTDDPLRERGGRGQEGARDLFGREAADLAQREGDLRVPAQRGMAAGEDQPQAIVLDPLIVVRLRGTGTLGQPLQDRREPGVERRPAAQAINRPEPARRDEPGARIGRHALHGPALQRRRERVLHRLLGEVEVSKEPDERREDAARVGSIQFLDPPARVPGLDAHAPITPGRTP